MKRWKQEKKMQGPERKESETKRPERKGLKMKRFGLIVTALVLAAAWMLPADNAWAAAQAGGASGQEHQIAVASDRHGNERAVAQAMGGMPQSVEYISLIGDMVGSGRDRTPEIDSSVLRDEMRSLDFAATAGKAPEAVTIEDVSVLWADHDTNVNDDAGIVFAAGGGASDDGLASGVMKTGHQADGSVAYYIYGIAFYEMRDQDKAEQAAKAFEAWIDTLQDQRIPILVFCHMPLHYARGDNAGAESWNRALNYAATGAETTEPGSPVIRNVLFAFGHNHTIESKTGVYSGEYYVPCGAQMELGAAAGNWSTIYYTYTTAGYLNQNQTASLLTIDADTITVSKYQDGTVSDEVYDDESAASGAFASRFETQGTNEIPRVQPVNTVLPEGCSITYTDKYGGSQSVSASGQTIWLSPGRVRAEINYADAAYVTDNFTVRRQDSLGDAAASGAANSQVFRMPKAGVRVEITKKERVSIAAAEVTGLEESYVYTGQAITPRVQVSMDGRPLRPDGRDYQLLYENNTKAGTARLTIEGTGAYIGSIVKTFRIEKAENPAQVTSVTKTVKYSKLKKKSCTVKPLKVSGKKTKITYTKLSGSGKLTVNKKTGKVTVAKGTKKGTYKIRVRARAAAGTNYKASTQTVQVMVRVR